MARKGKDELVYKTEVAKGRFKLRWRERVNVDGEVEVRWRAQTVTGAQVAIELQAKILRQLQIDGYYSEPARPETRITDFRAAAARWANHAKANGVRVETLRKHVGCLERFYGAVRHVKGLGEKDPIPATLLSSSLFDDVKVALRGRDLSESTIYSTIRVAYSAWKWASDSPTEWPGVPTPPRDASAVMPPTPIYTAPPAPTLAELDAVIRRLGRAYIAKWCAIVMRYTGLRISQVMAIEKSWVDLDRGTLRVGTGKSKRERQEQRTVPIAPDLIDLLRKMQGELMKKATLDYANSPYLLPMRRDRRTLSPRNHLPVATLTRAWAAATKAGEVREAVWRPAQREIGRPEHAFRAGFQAYLESRGARESVIDFLVGHAPATVRGRHYVAPDWTDLTEAVSMLPPIGATACANAKANERSHDEAAARVAKNGEGRRRRESFAS